MTERKIISGYTGSLSPNHEWSATLEGYEPGDAIGRGASEEQAISDLAEQLD